MAETWLSKSEGIAIDLPLAETKPTKEVF
jgi:hypothetical protein